MGFIRANMLPILKEHKRKSFSGKLLLLGQGDIYFTDVEYRQMAEMSGVDLDSSIKPGISYKKSFADKGYLDTQSVFKRLGFSEVLALDYSEFEGADIVYDLNQSEVPAHLLQYFDVIIDHGTLEHVFHLPNALKAIFNFLKLGGRMINSSPGNGFFDHGFYMFQPTLFYDYYAANKWDLESIQVVQFSHNQETEPCYFTDYYPGQFDTIGYGKMGDKLYSIICVATRTINATSEVIPQQGWYSRQASWRP
jgi:SAM-dependent methyltransferase